MRMFSTHIAMLLLCFFLSSHLCAQEVMPIAVKVETIAHEGDSIPHITLPALHKYPHFTFKNDRARKKYSRLVFNIKKVLPIAKLVRATIIETYEFLQMLPEDQRADHLKRVEKGLFEQYGKQMKKLTRTQGRLLVKLVDRECHNSGYAITKAFLGVVRANIYQGIALCFGNSLAKRYDPEGEDREVERIVLLIESGQL